jgi:hypothetical protein
MFLLVSLPLNLDFYNQMNRLILLANSIWLLKTINYSDEKYNFANFRFH